MQSHLKTWELELGDVDGLFNLAKGRCTTDSVWRRAARAEICNGKGGIAAAALQDIEAFYDKIGRETLVTLAASTNYPLAILRVSLTSYNWKRYIVIDGCTCDAIFGSRGVVAGSFSATYEAKAFLFRAVTT